MYGRSQLNGYFVSFSLSNESLEIFAASLDIIRHPGPAVCCSLHQLTKPISRGFSSFINLNTSAPFPSSSCLIILKPSCSEKHLLLLDLFNFLFMPFFRMEAFIFLLICFAFPSQAQLRSCFDVDGTPSLDFPCDPSSNVSNQALQRLDSLELSDCL